MTRQPVPAEFDGYRIVRPIGAGGMGQVYLGHDTLLDRPIAVKFINVSEHDPEARRRFLVEARAIARLQHACVVAVYRAGEHDGRPYLVSEFVEGQSLDKLELPLPWEEALRIGLDLARGLTVAHQAGVVHRDIKPANAILATTGTAKLLDFGIARLLGPGGAPEPHPEPPPASPAPPRLPAVPAAVDDDDDDCPTVGIALPDRLAEASQPAGPEAGIEQVTRPGRIMGTPLYMAPEVWRGEPATPAADVYSLGALLYVLCAGHPPHRVSGYAELRRCVQEEDAPPLARAVPDVGPAFAAVVDRCLARDPDQRFADGNAVRAALLHLAAPVPAPAVPEGNPYRGLRPFEATHQAFFFGRDSEIRAILERLQSDPVVIVTGDSGVGKSSLCRAGVLSRAPHWLGNDVEWSVATMVPGRHPVATLCAAVAESTGASSEALARALADGGTAFARELRRALSPQRGLVLFVDQLEELVTQAAPADAELLAPLLSRTGEPVPGFRILATVRGDFLGRLASLPQLGNSLSSVLFFLRPLSFDRLREAVEGPARVTGLRFESHDLVATLAASAAGMGGGLPLLQFALQKLWDRRDAHRQVIPASALAELGGVTGALSLHADETLAALGPSRRDKARRLFLRLVTPDGTRARRTRDEVTGGDPALEETLDALVQSRLVVATESPEGPVYEVAHEALLTGWGTLAGWLSANVESRVIQARLATACAEWERLGRSRDALWAGRQLAEARRVEPDDLADNEREFLNASRRTQRRKRVRRQVAVLVTVVALASTWGAVHLKTALEHAARVDGRLARADALLTTARGLAKQTRAAQARAWDLFDDRQPEAGEEAWAAAKAVRTRYREALAEAGRELETTVALAPERHDARQLFAQLLFQRAVEAEARGATAERDELLLRMELYDETGAMQKRWRAPADVSVTADGAVAGIRLERYNEDAQGRLIASPVAAPAELPWEAHRLEPGSYRLTLTLPSGGTVVQPLLLARGESLRVAVPVRPAAATPTGFVYVPGGRFLFGSGQEDSLRRGFHHTVPIHPATVDGYYIARHETTFAQWLEYLDALPPDQRAAHLPSVHAGGFEGALTLTRDEGGLWHLSFKPTAVKYTAGAGEQITYPGRKRNPRHDWLRFPVVGITAGDAAAYAAWLASTGRVPRARLCTDREWEFAARGADGREYPHGHFLAPDEANFDATYGKVPEAMGPDEVGSHPASRSVFGLDDMSGNVWEWTVSSVEPDGHAARGGSYYFDINSARTSNRETPEPSFRDTSVGFRLCADVPPDRP